MSDFGEYPRVTTSSGRLDGTIAPSSAPAAESGAVPIERQFLIEPGSAAAAGPSGGAGAPVPGGGDASAAASSSAPGDASFYQVAYYKRWFDVSTKDVLLRLLRALVPFRTSFLESVQGGPDLYGPFWINTTLIFFMAALGNLASWLNFAPTTEHPVWQYDFTLVTFAAASIYAYAGLLPLIVWVTLNHSDSDVSFIQCVCVYGYSMLIFIPAQMVCVVPSDVARWVSMGVALVWSSLFLGFSLMPELKRAVGVRGVILGVFMLLFHAALAVVMKIFFFTF